MATPIRSATLPTHLVVVCHGFMSTAERAANVAAMAGAAHPETLLVHVSTCNTGAYKSILTTTDGVDACGARVAAEVLGVLGAHSAISSLSLVGQSLGGVFARAALPAIVSARPDLLLLNFVSFASPHVGVRGHVSWAVEAAAGFGVLGASLLQLCLQDSPLPRADCGPKPLTLLEWMAHPRSPHARALASFSRRILVANLAHDDKVPHWSAALACDVDTLRLLACEGVPSASGASSPPLVTPIVAPGSAFPHVLAVYQQGDSSTLPMDHSTSAVTGGTGQADSNLPPSHRTWEFTQRRSGTVALGAMESVMVAHLRSVGPWINVDVLFSEPPAEAAHRRAAAAWPPELAGDVHRYVFAELFVARASGL